MAKKKVAKKVKKDKIKSTPEKYEAPKLIKFEKLEKLIVSGE
jgi:hypothetical protein